MPLALPSAALSWEIVKDTHAFLVKQRTIKKPFSKVCNPTHYFKNFHGISFGHHMAKKTRLVSMMIYYITKISEFQES
jgi:hypothetical protein